MLNNKEIYDTSATDKKLGIAIKLIDKDSNVIAKEYLKNTLVKIVTVVGFPLGACISKVKAFEAQKAIMDGADEIDMVINIAMLKDGRLDRVLSEINDIKSACEGRLLKVIIETCMLTETEKITMCDILSKSKA